MDYNYCVAIRTLGKSGDKFEREIQSLSQQTIVPRRILVYIAEGYDFPIVSSENVEFITCPKGMVAQRALPFSEVDTDLCLFLDDDVELDRDSVEKLIIAMQNSSADCVVADTFKNHEMPILHKVKAALINWVFPYYGNKWAFRVNRANSFSYNNNPKKTYYKSQSGAGPCALWKMSSFKAIHYEDELWLDNMGFSYGDDLLEFHKLYRNGGNLVVLYNCGVKHLDAKSSSDVFRAEASRFEKRAFIKYVLWRRMWFDARDLSFVDRVHSLIINFLKVVWDFFIFLSLSIISLSLRPIYGFSRGIIRGIMFTQSIEYKSIPNYILTSNN